MARIAVGGVQHETNVFAPYQADYEVFERHDEWPPLSRGMQMLDNVRGVHLPITGAIERLEALGHEIVPLLWCSATPSAHVTEEAFERIAAMMLETLHDSAPFDGVFLDLHAAAAAVSTLAPGQVGVDGVAVYGDAGGHPLDDDDEGLPV